MTRTVRFTQLAIFDVFDPRVGRVVSHLAALDRDGRIWESMAGLNGGELKLVPSPVIQRAKGNRRNAK